MYIIPDVHGRTFWKDVIKKHEKEKIIFLGDYLDPYMEEFLTGDVNYDFEARKKVREDAIKNFKEILEFKKEHKDNVILLVGNHDLEYMVSTDICDCRRDHLNYSIIQKLFRDNKKLFQICHLENNIMYSHSGIRREWFHDIVPNIEEKIIANYLNEQFEEMMSISSPEETMFAEELAYCSFYRGGWNMCSSLVWSDVREWIDDNSRPYSFYQVFGHTRLNGKPLVTKDWACLDCSRGFIFNENSQLTELNGDLLPIRIFNDEK